MSMGHTQSVALLGITGSLIEIEVDISDGIPMYSLLGLPDAALQESRDRVRAAITNCNEIWPNRKVTVYRCRQLGYLRVAQVLIYRSH